MVQKLCTFFVIIFLRMAIGLSINVDETFKEIYEAEEKFQLPDSSNIILVLGTTGVGKSTLVHYIAGDYSQIIAEERDGEIFVKDLLDVDYEKNPNISTTVSRTTVPEMVIDEHKNVFYDCPGFGDTRNTTTELLTNILIKTLIENVSKIKIVLVIDHNSVIESGDRANFDRMLRHAAKLLKNGRIFRDSISLVVTKMSEFSSRGKKRSETDEKQKVVEFMKIHRAELKKKGDKEQNKIEIIDAILLPTDFKNPKISIFWRPSDAGPLNTIVRMVEGRQKIRKSILEHTVYANIKGNSFDFSLKPETLLEVQQMERDTIDIIEKTLQNVDSELLKLLQTDLQTINEPFKKQKWLSLIDTSFLMPNASEMTIQQWANQFKILIDTFNLTRMNIKNIDRIEDNFDYFDTLKAISESKTEISVRDIIAKSSKTKAFLTNEYEWNSFLLQVYDLFGDYKVQKDVKLYNVKRLDDWERPNREQGLQINKQNFDAFVNKFQRNKKFESTDSRQNELNEIINETLKSPLRSECDNGTMTIKGNYVKSSDINPFVKCKSMRIMKINVYVVATFFVDSDLNLNNLTELNIFAHKWHILNNATFSLNGFNGQSQKIQAIIKSLASKRIGEEGKSGTDGGNFFGVASEMIDADKLTVQLNGGDGGQGQSVYTNIKNSNQIIDLICVSPPAKSALGGLHGNFLFVAPNRYNGSNSPVFETKNGLNGGSKIRNERNFKLNNFLYSLRCSRVLNPENDPNAGNLPNQRNPSPLTNLSLNIIAYRTFLFEEFKSSLFSEKIQETWNLLDNNSNINQAFKIDDFIRETNLIDDEFFKSHTNLKLLPFYDSLLKRISDYDRRNAYKMSKFDEKILKLLQMTILIKTNGMRNIQESDLIIHIERYLKELLPKIQNFNDQSNESDKIQRIFENGNFSIENYQSINELHDLYNGKIETKINEVNDFIESDIQPMIDELFDKIDSRIEKATTKIESRIERATTEIEPRTEKATYKFDYRIEKATSKIDSQTERTTTKDISNQNESSIPIQSSNVQDPGMPLSHRSKLIKSNLLKRLAIGAANKTVAFLKYLPSFGSAPAHMIGYDIDLMRGKSSEELKLDMIKLQSLLTSHDKQIFEAINFELNILIKSVHLMRNRNRNRELNKKLDEFSLTANRIKSAGRFEHDEVQNFLNNFMSFVNGRTNEVFTIKGSKKRIFQNAANAMALIAASVTHYRQLSNCKINGIRAEVGSVINEDQEILMNLIAIDDRINSRLMPLANFLKENSKQKSNYSAESLITLNVLKQQIPINYRLIQKDLDKLLTNVDGKSELEECFRGIKEVINLMLDIFDRIQKYEDRKKFNDLLTEFVSSSNDISHVIDAQTIQNLNDLMTNFKVSLILDHYYRSFDYFKQSVFPFGADYLKDYRITVNLSTLSSTNQMDAFIRDVKKKIEKLIQNIAELKLKTMKKIDGKNYNAFFDRKSFRANGPFYTWHKSEVKQKIQRLFNGEKIYLFADVRKAIPRNGVKFDQIGIDFQLNDQQYNESFVDILKEFHISLTHTGESIYRCDEHLFTVHSNPITIEISFDQKEIINHPIVSNDVYDNLRDNFAVLSPYTLWALELTHGDPSKLQPFIDRIENIDLIGHGRYFADNVVICDEDLDKYYMQKVVQMV